MIEIKSKYFIKYGIKIGQIQAERTLALKPINIEGYNFKDIKDIFKFWLENDNFTPTGKQITDKKEFLFWLSEIYSWKQTKFKNLGAGGTFLTNKEYSNYFGEIAKIHLDWNYSVYDLFCGLGSLGIGLNSNIDLEKGEKPFDINFVDNNQTFTDILEKLNFKTFNENILGSYNQKVKQIIANPPFGTGFDFDVFSKLIDLLDFNGIMILILPNNFLEKYRNVKKYNELFEKVKLIGEYGNDFEFTATKIKTSIFVFEKL